MAGSQIYLSYQIDSSPHLIFSGKDASDYKEIRQMGCQASTETFKNCSKNSSVTLTLHTPDYHYDKYNKKSQFSDEKLRHTTNPDLSTPFLQVCKHKIVQ